TVFEVVVVLVTTKPACWRVLVAVACGWPATFGTGTWTGPLLTTSTSGLSLCWRVPGGGWVVITWPAGAGFVCDWFDTLVKPRFWSSVVAGATCLPTTSAGTVRVLGEPHHPNDRPRKKIRTPSSASKAMRPAMSHHRRWDGSSTGCPSPGP